MRAPATLLTAGLSAAASLLLLTACGGSVQESSASGSSSSSAPSSSAAASSSPSAETVAFCSEAVALEESMNATVGRASADPTQLAPALQQLADQYAGIEAPQEIADDWGTLVDGIQQLATATQGIDVTDPSAVEQLQASVGGLEGRLTTATTNVSAYASANCPEAAPAS
jgi:hypothetical protein